jgi:hypothetical protein
MAIDARDVAQSNARECGEDEVHWHHRLPHDLKCAVTHKIERLADGAIHQVLNWQDAKLRAAIKECGANIGE